ncbi:hypothetical protein GQ55_5G282400 [Panicum hallii var. hallii]|uniref:RanBP2-type domain-containing protein n=2 Tax=Panicum hallii TaxID=206008 RepID=A0A2T7DL22_9POAL|nr:zinc finger Ran-binding domain-containing protein 2-like [Panicum hallii]PAN30488.1 hypothetical protein PAHAL_5G285600 [Panicum hallii]PUZ56271.1 hypothetical protein GQ55_5G282400 [Panicum hallii var. hallii]
MEKMNMVASRKPGDWSCRSCQYVNFCKRDACQRCGEAKLGGERTDYAALGGDWDVKPGDWYCCRCGVHNYASRGSCFKCSAAKNEAAAAVAQGWGFTVAGQAGMKPGDWICPRLGCNVQNYANRTECFRCNMPRSYYG